MLFIRHFSPFTCNSTLLTFLPNHLTISVITQLLQSTLSFCNYVRKQIQFNMYSSQRHHFKIENPILKPTLLIAFTVTFRQFTVFFRPLSYVYMFQMWTY